MALQLPVTCLQADAARRAGSRQRLNARSQAAVSLTSCYLEVANALEALRHCPRRSH